MPAKLMAASCSTSPVSIQSISYSPEACVQTACTQAFFMETGGFIVQVQQRILLRRFANRRRV
jgi:hypothetical protein